MNKNIGRSCLRQAHRGRGVGRAGGWRSDISNGAYAQIIGEKLQSQSKVRAAAVTRTTARASMAPKSISVFESAAMEARPPPLRPPTRSGYSSQEYDARRRWKFLRREHRGRREPRQGGFANGATARVSRRHRLAVSGLCVHPIL
jgi:hypothetical protein